jgi:hypothetical protein
MAIFFIIIIFGVPLAVLKYLGMRAMRPVSVDIAGPTLQQLVEAGTKASHSLARRMFSTPRAVPVEGGGALWEIRTGAGVMTVLIEPLADGAGHRVTAQATSVRVVQARGEVDRHTDYGRAKIFTNWLFRLMGIPHNARKLLRQRRRVLRAVSRIGRVIPPAPAQAALPQPTDTPDAQLQ